MDHADVKNAIVSLLEEIVGRTNYINRQHPAKDLSLDIDLVKDDLRLLYRQLESLKDISGNKASAASPVESGAVGVHPVTAAAPAPPPQEAPPSTPVAPDPPASETMPPHEEQGSAPASDETPPPEGASEPTPEECPSSIPHPPDPGNSKGQNSSEGPATSPTIPFPSGEQTPPVHEPSTPSPGETSSPAQPAPTETGNSPAPTRKSNPSSDKGNKAVIDLLSEYAERTIGDLYMQEDNSVHNRIAGEKEDRSIGARMQQEPISSLREVIGVNEKFLFINELFQGDIQAYNDAIARLNEMGGVKEAFDYLNQLGMDNAWDAGRSKATIEKLANYVQRKHMTA